MKADISGLSSALGRYGKARGEALADDAKSRAAAARAKGEAHADALRAQAEDYQRQAVEFVNEKPGTAIGIAAAIGFLVGLFFAPRR